MAHRFFALAFYLAMASFAACGGSPPKDLRFQPSAEASKLPPNARVQLEAALTKFFGTPASPVAFKDSELDSGLDPAKLGRAPQLYRIQCVHCHGTTGDGEGPTARFLNPRPRDYRRGTFKFTSTAAATKPTREDLLRILKDGVNYTAMPSFVLYPEEDLKALVEYVILLSMRGELERFLASNEWNEQGQVMDEDEGDYVAAEAMARTWAGRIFDAWRGAPSAVVHPAAPKPSFTAESANRGKDLFLGASAQCMSCHGTDGKGLEGDKRDDWGFPTKPADLTRGIYRGGGRPIDLYRRIAVGIKGTPMPGFGPGTGANLTAEQVWDLVHYVQSLKRAEL